MSLSQEHIDSILARKRRPCGPGSVLLDILEDEDNNISVESFAEQLEVSYEFLAHVIEGEYPMTKDIANKIGNIFGNGPELWLRLQEGVDIWDKHNTNK